MENSGLGSMRCRTDKLMGHAISPFDDHAKSDAITPKLISSIFSFLDEENRYTASLVSKKWRQLLIDEHLILGEMPAKIKRLELIKEEDISHIQDGKITYQLGFQNRLFVALYDAFEEAHLNIFSLDENKVIFSLKIADKKIKKMQIHNGFLYMGTEDKSLKIVDLTHYELIETEFELGEGWQIYGNKLYNFYNILKTFGTKIKLYAYDFENPREFKKIKGFKLKDLNAHKLCNFCFHNNNLIIIMSDDHSMPVCRVINLKTNSYKDIDLCKLKVQRYAKELDNSARTILRNKIDKMKISDETLFIQDKQKIIKMDLKNGEVKKETIFSSKMYIDNFLVMGYKLFAIARLKNGNPHLIIGDLVTRTTSKKFHLDIEPPYDLFYHDGCLLIQHSGGIKKLVFAAESIPNEMKPHLGSKLYKTLIKQPCSYFFNQ